MTLIQTLFGVFLAGIVLACLGILGVVLIRVRDNRNNPDGYITPDEVQATAERIYQITHPLEDEIATQEIRVDPLPEPVPVAWYDLPVDPDEAAPHFPAGLPIFDVDLSFTRGWNRAELAERVRAAEERAVQAGLVTR